MMPSIPIFAPTYQSKLSFENLEPLSRDTSKKRKRDNVSTDIDPDLPTIEGPLTQLSESRSHLLLNNDSATQRGTPKQALEESLHGSNFTRDFPHHSPSSPQYKPKEEISNELATLKPPLCSAKDPGGAIHPILLGSSGLRQRHLAVITAALQRCLLLGDYVRASRAWGLLLRTEHNGHTMDLRASDRWGIGAEILLRRETQFVQKEDGRKSSVHEVAEFDQACGRCFSVEGFEKAKDYYERLVLQYPYRKVAPNATGPLNFYPAMFGLWIYSVDQQHLVELRGIRKTHARELQDSRKVRHDTESEIEPEATSASAVELNLQYSKEYERILKRTINRAEEIVRRVSDLMASPPYSTSDILKRLHNMMDLWVKDLSADGLPLAIASDNVSSFAEEDGNSAMENPSD